MTRDALIVKISTVDDAMVSIKSAMQDIRDIPELEYIRQDLDAIRRELQAYYDDWDAQYDPDEEHEETLREHMMEVL